MRPNRNPNYWRDAGQRLRTTRLALGISEQEAADAGGVTLRTYRKYEAGFPQRKWDFMGFVTKYDVSLDWIIRGEGEALGRHLAKNVGEKIAILPVRGPERRRHLARSG
jgi:transcriptional regulator with XRE-family HTH domain